ncbi:MAG: DUF4321 domain-containing protein [bacterium]
MKSRGVRSSGRSIGLLILAVVVAGIAGSIISYFLAGLFPASPVRDFFFKSLQIGLRSFTLDLGFATLTFGISFGITTFTVFLIGLAIYLWYRF